MKPNSKYKPLIPAVEQASRVLIYLSQGDTFHKNLTDIYKNVGIHKSKAYTILNTLMKFDFVEKDIHTKTYSLGPGLVSLSRYFLDNLSYPEIVTPFMKELATETKGAAFFGIIAGEHVIVIAKYVENQTMGLTIPPLGRKFDITWGASGKCITAFMSPDEREKILDKKKLYFCGDPSLLDIKRLKIELEEAKKKGYAIDKGEITPGINFISAPVFASNNKVVGCLQLAGKFVEDQMEIYGTKVADAAKQVSYGLGANLKNITVGK